MELLIKITTRDIYGKKTYYPNDQTSHLFCELLGQRTLTTRDIDVIKRMGYTVLATREEVAL